MGEASNAFLTRSLTAQEQAEMIELRDREARAKRRDQGQRTSAARDADATEGLGDIG